MDKNCLLEKTAEITKQKLKEYYNSQDKLVPLFDDLPQSIDTCYVRLVLLTQQQFQERKDKISNKQEEKEDSDHKIREEDEKWPNIMDYSLIYSEQKTIKLENIWRVEKERKDTENTKNKKTEKMEENGDKSNDNIQEKWIKIMNELNISQWNTDDTKCVMNAKNGLLLVLDGFDEIANELNTKPGLQKWLEDCALNTNYSIIMTSRPNAMCSYLNNKLRRLNVIGFQKEDIKNYVHGYFRNITNDVNNNQGNTLIKILNNNQNLQLLSHTPLQEINDLNEIHEIKEEKKENRNENKIFDGLNNISVSKLYEKLLECYMKWNWTKSNEMKEKINPQNMFNIFEMEIDYLSHLAWEGMKLEQVIISCEMQEKSLHWIKKKYPRKCIAIPSQWSRIHSFGFLQGQESMNPSHPINS
ncbi:hypothetical protein RFI_22204, partial [Reticulomyxa filosa]